MFSRKTLGIAGAAILGTLVGTNPAHAVIMVDDDGDVTDQIKVAKETLDASITKDGTKYYKVTESSSGGEFDVSIPYGFAGNNRDIIVQYTLGGMVFTDASMVGLTHSGHGTIAGTIGKLSGGDAKDDTVRFSISGGTVIATDDLLLEIRELAVDPGAVGTITMVASYSFSGLTVSETVTIADAVKTMDALNAAVTPDSATALVTEGFQKFGPEGADNVVTGGLTASVGKIAIGNETGFVSASSTAITAPTELMGTETAALTFAGDISFVDDVFLSTTVGCTTNDTTLFKTEEEVKSWKAGADTGAPVLADVDATGGAFLCFTVDGETAIPKGDYTVTISYDPLTTTAAFPPATKTSTVGSIRHDGTTVHIPYLTTDDRYNQKLVLINRNSSAVEYTIKFTGEEGVTPTAGADAAGMLQPGRTVLSLRNDDVVSFGEGEKQRTAATVDVVSISGNISVAVVTLTRSNGSVDTVTYH